jgi:hypothetical protein
VNVIEEYDRGAPERQRRRLTNRWTANGANLLTDGGPEEKALHVATCVGEAVAQHITELHNRTFGDGQEPAGQRLIDRKAAELLASQPVLVQLDSDPARMADVLRKLGYEVTEPKEGT